MIKWNYTYILTHLKGHDRERKKKENKRDWERERGGWTWGGERNRGETVKREGEEIEKKEGERGVKTEEAENH